MTLPIPTLRSNASFIPDKTDIEITGSRSNTKAIEACKKLLQWFDMKGGGRLWIHSNIPVGKGMASSSADIVAAIKATAHSYSLPLTEDIISSIASEIEPTDGVMYDDVVAYDYLNGQLIESLGHLPPFLLIGIDVGGMVDTIQFNQLLKPYDGRDRNQFLEAYELVKIGMGNKDLSLICKAATISAHINQKILPKPYFSEFERLSNVFQGGLFIAHSGTVLGILLDSNVPNIIDVFSKISKQISLIINNTRIKTFYCFGGYMNYKK
ncbi:GHMP family kinase ATP-binding protein [Peribacillus cavernae]|uniref:GHMP family kinase ATP-binding protein n=1 Tax=Peribacillus cavernae TaxID=1674310 RepID=UPI003F99E43F